MIRPLDEVLGGPLRKHLDDARLAALAAGDLPLEGEETHLATCRQCSAIHAELVQLRAVDTTGPLRAPRGIVSTGLEFVEERVGRHSRPARSVLSRRWKPVIRVLAPSFALAALLLVMVIGSNRNAAIRSADLPEPVRLSLIESSSHGWVHPFVADASAFEAPVLRGVPTASEAMAETLGRLLSDWEKDPNSVESSALLIAAFQAAGQSDNAQAYLREALRRHPRDETLQSLQIAQFYLRGEFSRAEDALRSDLDQDAGSPLTRLNLAILLSQSPDAEKRQEGRRLATELSAEWGESPLGRRAQRILG